MLLEMKNRTPSIVFLGAIAATFGSCSLIRTDAFQPVAVPNRSVRVTSFGRRSQSLLTCGQIQRPKRSHLHSTLNGGEGEKLMTIFSSNTTNEVVPSTWNKAVERFFLGDSGPPLVVLSVLGFTFARFQTSQPVSMTDATIFVSTIVIWWIQEYFFHRILLHSPFDWVGKTIHKTHHEKDYFHVSIDPPALLLGWLFAAHFIMKSFLPWHLCLTATIGYASAGLFYEWSHYIVHTRVKATVLSQDNSLSGSISNAAARIFTQMRNNHIRHHRVDDNNWFAFSIPSMDDMFGTNPEIKGLKCGKN